MKLFITSFFSLLALCMAGAAQTSIKIFDATPISPSNSAIWLTGAPAQGIYKRAEVNLSCPSGRKSKTTLSGPFGGQLAADDFILVNDASVCGKGKSCFSSVYANPWYYLGMPVDIVYEQVNPIDISGQISGSGLYVFYLMDVGQIYGNTDIYLNTTCSIAGADTSTSEPPATDGGSTGSSLICHRDNGSNFNQTIAVTTASLAAHLGHGDTIGACTK